MSEIGLCEKCHAKPGAPHAFYYGFMDETGYVIRETGLRTEISRSYSVKGKQEAIICQQCIIKKRLTEILPLVAGTAVTLGPALLIFLSGYHRKPEGGATLLGLLGMPLALFGVGMLAAFIFHLFLSNQEYGDMVAIGLKGEELRKQGLSNRCWTSKEYRELTGKKR